MTRRSSRRRRQSRGFSLVEVMVAVVVCAVGLLGLAKMESLAIASTAVASTRSIAAIQAASLASAMKSNGAFWANGLAPATTKVNIVNGVNGATTTIVSPVPEFGTTQACATTPPTPACTPAQLAAYDVEEWANNLAQQGQLQAFTGTITCSTTQFPVTCTIQLEWAENAVAMNSADPGSTAGQTPDGMVGLQKQSINAPYVLYVQP